MLDIDHLPSIYTRWRDRQTERDTRYLAIDTLVRGDMKAFDPDEEEIENRSPNFVQIALEDTAEAASVLPTVRVSPIDTDTPTQKQDAERMERIGMGYLTTSEWDVLIQQMGLDWLAFGASPLMVWPDLDSQTIRIAKMDPREFYPDDTYRPGDRQVRAAIFAREVHLSALPEREQEIIADDLAQRAQMMTWSTSEDPMVTIVEYLDEHEFITAALISLHATSFTQSITAHSAGDGWIPVEFSRIENPIGVTPVVLSDKITLDGEFRGQYDQLLGLMQAHQRLFGLMMDFSDQAVYSDLYVKGLVGELPYGGGAVVQLGPDGEVGRIPPAVSSLDVQRDLEHLVNSIHLGGRWPKSRPGEIDQAIASAKFLEATAGIMNTLIRTMHSSFSRTFAKALNLAYNLDVKLAESLPEKVWPKEKRTSGVLRNQTFLENYKVSQIHLDYQVRVDYGIAFGREPAQSTVMAIQLQGNDLMSRESVMESLDGLQDAPREMRRMDVEMLTEFLKADLAQRIQTQAIPPSAVIDMIEAREKGDTLVQIYRQFVIEPQEQAMSGALSTPLSGPIGPDGAPLPPGLVGPGQGPAGPGGAPPAPSAPPPAELLARLNVPAGPGGTLGSQVERGGG